MDLEKISKAGAFIYGFMILTGALYLETFYGIFHINIFKYLDISEILVSFINNIMSMLLLLGVIILEVVFFKRIIKAPKFYEKDVYRIFGIAICTGLTFIYLLFIRTNYIENNKMNDFEYIIYPAYALIALFALFEFYFFEYNKNIRHSGSYIIIYALLAFFLLISRDAVNDAKLTVNSAKGEIVTIITNDSIITSNRDYFYLGRTNKFVFLYRLSDDHRDLIPAEHVKKISFKMLKD